MVFSGSETYTDSPQLAKRGTSSNVIIGESVSDSTEVHDQPIACDICHKAPCQTQCQMRLRVDVLTFFPCNMKWKPCSLLAEFVFSAILAFFLGMSGLVPGHTQVSSALVHGAILVGAVASAGAISGAHFSAFVSLVVAMNGQLSWLALLLYWLAQFLGWLVGTAFILIFFDTGTGLNVPVPQPGFSFLQAFGMEIIGTFTLVLFILFTQRQKVNVAIVLGLSFIGITLIGLPISGASYNFWRYLAPAIFAGPWTPIWVYLVGEFLGSLLAWIIYRLCCWLEKYNDIRFGMC